MSMPVIISLICGGVLIVLTIAVVCIRMANKKRFNKLQENLKKYKEENEQLDKENKVILSKEPEPDKPLPVSDEKVAESKQEQQESYVEKENKQGPIVEDYISSNTIQFRPTKEQAVHTFRDREAVNFSNKNLNDNYTSEYERRNSNSYRKEQSDDFEDFLDKHAYSRRILNKDILSKIRQLPPEIKAVILSNVFNKYDD